MKVEFKTGDRVRPKSENDAFAIACGFVTNPDSPITTDTEFEVAVVVVEGITHNNVKESGLIIVPIGYGCQNRLEENDGTRILLYLHNRQSIKNLRWNT